MAEPTAKQERFLKFIREFCMEYGYSPSVREIARGLGLSSTSGVKSMIDRLTDRGYLRREPGIARAVSLPEAQGVPVLGRIRAGIPVMAEENIEGYIPLQDFMKTSSGGFFLIVEGESMKDKGILPGDYAFIQPQKVISNGQIGAFRLNGEVTLKTFSRKDEEILLLPANDEFKAIHVGIDDDFEVIGRFVMLLRMVEKGYDRRLL
jgi:repressor LexA